MLNKKMRITLLAGLIVLGNITTQMSYAAPSNAVQPVISQIVVTQYTGSDASHPKAEPIYRIALKQDGNAVYVGSKTYMKLTGRHHGTIDKSDFLRLANLFQDNNLSTSPNSYNKYDGPDYKGRQVASRKYEIISGSRKKTIMVYEDSGPQFIRRAGQIEYGLLWKIQWQKISSSGAIAD